MTLLPSILSKTERLMSKSKVSKLRTSFYEASSLGISLIEVLVIVAIVALFIIMAMGVFLPQLQKSRDAQRKDDLYNIKTAFEYYFSDHGCYPPREILDNCGSSDLAPYLHQIPCDPLRQHSYVYAPQDHDCPQSYRVYSILERTDDPVIVELGCAGAVGCGANDLSVLDGVWDGLEGFGLSSEDFRYGVSEGVPVYTGAGFLTSGFCCMCDDQGGACNYNPDGDTELCVGGFYADAASCESATNCDSHCQTLMDI